MGGMGVLCRKFHAIQANERSVEEFEGIPRCESRVEATEGNIVRIITARPTPIQLNLLKWSSVCTNWQLIGIN